MYKAIFVDLDNTLFSFDNMYQFVARDALDNTIGLSQLGRSFQEFYTQFRKFADELYHQYEQRKITIDQYHDLRWLHTFSYFQLDIASDQYHDLNEYIMNHYLEYVEVFPGVEAFLDRCRASYKLGLITNGPVSMQMAKLEKMGLTKWFDQELLIISERVGVSKPNRLIFEHALKAARIKPAEALHIGDSFHHDIIGANAVGMSSGLVHQQKLIAKESPTFVFRDFFEVAKITLD